MFFIMGIFDKSKELEYNGAMHICQKCGRYCSYNVFVKYMCLSIFFIPLLKFGKRYFVISNCCSEIHELDKTKGRMIERGNAAVITAEDLK